jgi:hypothetical protein
VWCIRCWRIRYEPVPCIRRYARSTMHQVLAHCAPCIRWRILCHAHQCLCIPAMHPATTGAHQVLCIRWHPGHAASVVILAPCIRWRIRCRASGVVHQVWRILGPVGCIFRLNPPSDHSSTSSSSWGVLRPGRECLRWWACWTIAS